MLDLRRREFITLLGGAAVAWPLGAGAQQPTRPSSSPNLVAAFRQGLRGLGYIEGLNLFIERRYAEGREERLPQLARELVEYGVDVIFAIGPPQALAAAKATALTFPNRPRIVESALRARMPTLGALREYAEAGLLMSYGPSYADHCRRAATYVDQILKGAKPADLPVQLPTAFEFVVNLKTAKALGLDVPLQLQQLADTVIE
jgi:ABC-type uncharacterized transport system substrate-binding protein